MKKSQTILRQAACRFFAGEATRGEDAEGQGPVPERLGGLVIARGQGKHIGRAQRAPVEHDEKKDGGQVAGQRPFGQDGQGGRKRGPGEVRFHRVAAKVEDLRVEAYAQDGHEEPEHFQRHGGGRLFLQPHRGLGGAGEKEQVGAHLGDRAYLVPVVGGHQDHAQGDEQPGDGADYVGSLDGGEGLEE